MYLIVLPGFVIPCDKNNLESSLGEIIHNGLPVGKTPDGKYQVLRMKKEAIKVFDISSLEVDINTLNIPESSILRVS